MNYAGVVVLYNPNDYVVSNIDSYISKIRKLYIVDNSEKENSSLFSVFNNVEYIYNGENLGIAKALNIAANKALKEGYDFLLTMDQDSRFRNNDIDILMSFIDNYPISKDLISKFSEDINNIAIVSPNHYDNNTPIAIDISRGSYDSPINVMTSGNLINLRIWKTLHGFNEDYFIDCVDFEYCLKARKYGYHIIRCNESVLIHSLGNRVDKHIFGKEYVSFEHNWIRRYYIVRNRCYLCNSYKHDFSDYIKLEKKCTRKELKLVWICEKNKLKKTYYMIKGFFDYKKGKTGRLT